MTGAEMKKASRERLTQQERINDWELCINFLMASSQFENFVKTNKLQSQLHEIAVKYGDEKDIAKLVFNVFDEFRSNIPVYLQDEIRSMFLF